MDVHRCQGACGVAHIQGDPSLKLEDYREVAPFDVSSDTIADGTDRAFPVPPAPAWGC